MNSTLGDNKMKMHHIGYVVRSIDEVANRFSASVGASWDGKVILDSLQGAQVAFLGNGNGPLIELVQPTAEASPVSGFLSRGGGLHHLCYEIESLEEQLKASRLLGGSLVRAPLPAVAFNGRLIAWVLTKERLLLEFLEKASIGAEL